MVGICALGAFANVIWTGENWTRATYLNFENPTGFSNEIERFVVKFFSFFLLMAQAIPVSLYVTMAFSRICQMYFIQWDLEMRHKTKSVTTGEDVVVETRVQVSLQVSVHLRLCNRFSSAN